MRIQSAVFTETRSIAYGTAVCLVITNAVALVIGKWDITVLLGALLGGVCAVFCFLQMALTVQRITELSGEDGEKLKRGKRMMSRSYLLRLAIMALTFVLAAKTAPFNWLAMAVMLLAPRLAIMARQGFISLRKMKSKAQPSNDSNDSDDKTEEVNE